MGSSSSRLIAGSPPPQVNRTKQPRRFSSILCGCSSSYDPVELQYMPVQYDDHIDRIHNKLGRQMENNPAESSVSSVDLCEPVFDKEKNQYDEFYRLSRMDEGLTPSTSEAGSSSEIRTSGNQENPTLSSLENCLQKGKELIPPLVSENSTNGLDKDKNATSSSASFQQLSHEQVSQHDSANKVVENGIASAVSDEAPGVSHGGNSHPENETFGDANFEIVNNGGVTALDTSTSAVSRHIDLPNRDDNSSEMVSSEFEFPIFDREHNVEDEVLVDVLSVPTSALSSTAADTNTSSWDSRRNSRSFWEVFADQNSVDNAESQIVLSADDSDYTESRERWLFGYSDLFSDEGVRDRSGFLGSRIHRSNQRHRRRRYEIFDRLRTGLSENNMQASSCPSGIHPDGECSCDRSLTAELSSAHQSISRIVMLAEALFEVLDEIHHRPASFSLAIASDTAPASVVDSLPLKSYKKIEATESVDSIEQCNICFAEYDEGDRIRVLPCHHEYHMACVDKWLKEIHGICPLCRGDVRETAASNSVIP